MPLVIGVVRTILDKGKALIPLVGFTLLYVFSFVATGNFYARVHPWYFAPVLPAAYLFVGVGCVWVFSTVGKKFTYFRSFSRYGILELIFVGIWTGFMLNGPDTQAVKKLFSMNSGRERLYAAGAVWAGTYLDKGSTIAASEIGAIGFFSPGDISVLDMFGLLRHKQEVNTKYIKLLRRDRPELILTRVLFEDRMRVEKAMMGSYVWFGFRTLEIGVRSDLVDELSPHLDELPGIYETLDIRKEYSWSRGLKMGIDEQ